MFSKIIILKKDRSFVFATDYSLPYSLSTIIFISHVNNYNCVVGHIISSGVSLENCDKNTFPVQVRLLCGNLIKINNYKCGTLGAKGTITYNGFYFTLESFGSLSYLKLK